MGPIMLVYGMTHDELLSRIDYNPSTGLFTSRHTGSLLSSKKDREGYLRISIKGRMYRTARLAFFFMTGRWPTPTVDHKNRIRDDDRWENLREATYFEQSKNRAVMEIPLPVGVSRAPKTHGDGVYFRSDRKKCWRARTWVLTPNGRRRVSIGQFFTEQEAIDAYNAYRNSS